MMRETAKTPCRDCKERVLGCHATCQKYIDWKKEVDEYNAKMYADKKARYIPEEFLYRRSKRER